MEFIGGSMAAVSGLALLFGLFMKLADLTHEHGLHLFKGDKILFGIIWGILGGILIASNEQAGNVLLAMILGFVVRDSLDHLGHKIGAAIMFTVFVLNNVLLPGRFLIFFFLFIILGSWEDRVEEALIREPLIPKLLDLLLYYPLLGLFDYFLFSKAVFFVLVFFTLGYDAVKLLGRSRGYYLIRL